MGHVMQSLVSAAAGKSTLIDLFASVPIPKSANSAIHPGTLSCERRNQMDADNLAILCGYGFEAPL
jgi:hypothetical protein